MSLGSYSHALLFIVKETSDIKSISIKTLMVSRENFCNIFLESEKEVGCVCCCIIVHFRKEVFRSKFHLRAVRCTPNFCDDDLLVGRVVVDLNDGTPFRNTSLKPYSDPNPPPYPNRID